MESKYKHLWTAVDLQLNSMSALLICDHKDMWTVCDKDQIAPRVAQIAVIITAITAICDTGIKSRQSTEMLSSMCDLPTRHET